MIAPPAVAYGTCVTSQAANDAAPKLTPTRGEIRPTLTGRFSAQFGWFVEPRTVPIGIESLG
jgi:hypothetical protein